MPTNDEIVECIMAANPGISLYDAVIKAMRGELENLVAETLPQKTPNWDAFLAGKWPEERVIYAD